jgi:hypothetical protein
MLFRRLSSRHIRSQLGAAKLARSQQRFQHFRFLAGEGIHHFLYTTSEDSGVEAIPSSIQTNKRPNFAACE